MEKHTINLPYKHCVFFFAKFHGENSGINNFLSASAFLLQLFCLFAFYGIYVCSLLFVKKLYKWLPFVIVLFYIIIVFACLCSIWVIGYVDLLIPYSDFVFLRIINSSSVKKGGLRFPCFCVFGPLSPPSSSYAHKQTAFC